jgi:hypothetical protein
MCLQWIEETSIGVLWTKVGLVNGIMAWVGCMTESFYLLVLNRFLLGAIVGGIGGIRVTPFVMQIQRID